MKSIMALCLGSILLTGCIMNLDPTALEALVKQDEIIKKQEQQIKDNQIELEKCRAMIQKCPVKY